MCEGRTKYKKRDEAVGRSSAFRSRKARKNVSWLAVELNYRQPKLTRLLVLFYSLIHWEYFKECSKKNYISLHMIVVIT